MKQRVGSTLDIIGINEGQLLAIEVRALDGSGKIRAQSGQVVITSIMRFP